jgi:histidinol-phosphate aminotransferase
VSITAVTAGVADLRDSVNLWGPPPSARDVRSGLGQGRLAHYPGPGGGRLVPALARHLRVREDEIAVGCGSDELIDAAFRLAGAGAELRYVVPTFSMVPVYAAANRLTARPVCTRPDGEIEPGSLTPSPGGAAYLCSPNNPTGAPLPPRVVDTVLARAPAGSLVIIDSAYADFTDQPDWFDEATGFEGCLVLRTFSKAWGLAGLRVGYAVGHARLIARLNVTRGPYMVNAVAEEIVPRVIERDAAWVRARASEAAENRDRLIDRLVAMGHAPCPSHANFVLVPVADATVAAARLLLHGVAVRPFSALPGVGDAIRIGVGPWPLLERCLRGLSELRP